MGLEESVQPTHVESAFFLKEQIAVTDGVPSPRVSHGLGDKHGLGDEPFVSFS